jgi:hypothetical protein
MPKIIGTLYGPAKPDLRSPLTLAGDIRANTQISLRISAVSVKATLVARAGAKVIAQLPLDPTVKPANWKPVKSGKYTQHEPAKTLTFIASPAQDVREISFENVDGDWVRCNEIAVTPPGLRRRAYGTDTSYGKHQIPLQIAADGRILPPPGSDPDSQLAEYLAPWIDAASKGVPVFVGEWGCYNKTPHPVVLAWMKDWLNRWKRARFGWALWNFRGSFGILDSDRPDVSYEDWHGHKLDRKMLDLLLEYRQY